MSRSIQISRRATLRGLGTMMALPLLDAMMPKMIRAAVEVPGVAPRRMAFVYVPHGAYMPYWTPTTEGTDYELTPCLEPLAEHRKEMTVIGGLKCDNAMPKSDGGGDHARAGGAYLTCARPKKTPGADFEAGVSIDQFAAQQVGDRTRFPSMEIGIEGYRGAGNCDNGYACVYEHTLSWGNATTPLPPEVNPRLVFNRLFADQDNDPESLARAQLRASVLDGVLEDARDLNRKLGGHDLRKMDQYLTGVRELEKRIQRAESLSPVVLPDDVTRPAGVPADLTEHIRLMCDLMVLALQTDVTRIATFMLGREGSEQKYRMVGVNEGHHTISHHQNKPDNIAKIKAISIYHSTQLAYLISRLKSTKEGDGTLLDNVSLAYGSCIADPNSHAHDNLPTILFGKNGGAVSPGKYIRYPKNTPLANLWLTMLNNFGVKTDKFGDSNAMLEGLG